MSPGQLRSQTVGRYSSPVCVRVKRFHFESVYFRVAVGDNRWGSPQMSTSVLHTMRNPTQSTVNSPVCFIRTVFHFGIVKMNTSLLSLSDRQTTACGFRDRQQITDRLESKQWRVESKYFLLACFFLKTCKLLNCTFSLHNQLSCVGGFSEVLGFTLHDWGDPHDQTFGQEEARTSRFGLQTTSRYDGAGVRFLPSFISAHTYISIHTVHSATF